MKTKCIEKQKFGHVNEAMHRIRQVYFTRGIRLYLYECPKCADFHLTKTPNDYGLVHWHVLSRDLRKRVFRKWFPHWERTSTQQLMDNARVEYRKHLEAKKISTQSTVPEYCAKYQPSVLFWADEYALK